MEPKLYCWTVETILLRDNKLCHSCSYKCGILYVGLSPLQLHRRQVPFIVWQCNTRSLKSFFHLSNQANMKLYLTEGYQPKATTLTCVLVRMVALELIPSYHFPNYSLFLILKHKCKTTNINEYFTSYVWRRCHLYLLWTKCEVISVGDTPHPVRVLF